MLIVEDTDGAELLALGTARISIRPDLLCYYCPVGEPLQIRLPQTARWVERRPGDIIKPDPMWVDVRVIAPVMSSPSPYLVCRRGHEPLLSRLPTFAPSQLWRERYAERGRDADR